MICCAVAEADVPLLLHHLLLLAVIVKNNRVEDELDEHDYEPVGTAGRAEQGRVRDTDRDKADSADGDNLSAAQL